MLLVYNIWLLSDFTSTAGGKELWVGFSAMDFGWMGFYAFRFDLWMMMTSHLYLAFRIIISNMRKWNGTSLQNYFALCLEYLATSLKPFHRRFIY